jgi:hypothetical protein
MLGFVHIPKTAGSSLKFILRNTFCLRHCQLFVVDYHGATDSDLAFARRVHKFGLECISGHGLVAPTLNISEPIDYFTILRDPQKRCLSQYLHQKRAHRRAGREYSFAEFISAERMADLQVTMIAGRQDLDRAKSELDRYLFVGFLEHFAESIVALDRLCEYDLKLEYLRLHVTKNQDDMQEVLEDPAAMAALEKANRLDQALYDYARQEIFPRHLEAAGVELGSVDASTLELQKLTRRYWLNRWFQKLVYRPLAKRHRKRCRASS